MAAVVIENPILNSPFLAPTRHFRFDDDGITNEVVAGRRVSSYFVPIAKPKKRGKQLAFDTEWTQDRIEENSEVNRIRHRVGLWRQGGYLGVTPTTRALLEYWTNPERERKLFFCQIEALETAIYITEGARKFNDAWIENFIVDTNNLSNPGLPRQALKMATGTGKTVVMAMLIAWQALNKLANPQDARFTDSFLAVAPGITIRDRLRVLMPNDPRNYYRERDLVPAADMDRLGQARIVITNFHAFQLREKTPSSKLTKTILASGAGGASPFTETAAEMVRRVCRELGTKKNIIVLNDEAHHCYRRKPDALDEKLTGEDRVEAKQRDEEARIWISGLEAIQRKLGIKTIYDLSATPFFLKGSGYSEGTLFPWVVSDFSLIDAIEAGIVKVPRVPVADNAMTGDLPVFRDLWLRIRDDLPKKGRKTDAIGGEPKLSAALEAALFSLYGNYARAYERWAATERDRAGGTTPPVFIVVCNNTNVSKLVYDFVAGWEKPVGDQTIVQAGKLEHFRNDDGHGAWRQRPNTILIDSQQLESGEAMSDEFKRAAAREIDEFKAEYRQRFPGRDAEELTDEDLLREVMNSVGKPGRLGEHIRCVISVSMLTEGWDANTVTHILGVRAFGTQLLCEQVVGRALRRMSYAADDDGMFAPEYAEVYGVPFSFIPSSGATGKLTPGPTPTRVRALPDRVAAQITFPRLLGYRFELPDERLTASFDADSRLPLSTQEVPTWTDVNPVIGEASRHDLYDLKRHRPNSVAFEIARRTLETKFQDTSGIAAGESDQQVLDRPWLFPQVLAITKLWLDECVILNDDGFLQMLMIPAYQQAAVERVYHSIVTGTTGGGTQRLLPMLRPYDTVGSTEYVDFDTTKPTYVTDPAKCHVSHVVADTDSWEQKLAQTLEEMPEVRHYVKNAGLGFTIPYTDDSNTNRQYIPDFLIHLQLADGEEQPHTLILEVTGERKREKQIKTSVARDLWVPAVNSHGGFGQWSFLEITDPWEAAKTIRAHLATLAAPQTAGSVAGR